jgi:patatin-like phospholipase/acyl hydrolase
VKRILQIDGGGIRGIIPAIVLEHLEEKCGKPLGQCFDLITGTSTGSIIGGAIAAGVPAKKIRELYADKGKELFTRRTLLNPFNWLRGKYDGERFKNEMGKLSGINKTGEQVKFEDLILADLTPRFVATTFNLLSQRTHFINSWDDKPYKKIQDKSRKLLDVISWSALSAVYYFDPITVDNFEWQDRLTGDVKKGAFFEDGGQGAHNNTLGYVLAEILACRWTQQEEVYVLSLGTGYQPHIFHNGVLKKGISFVKRLSSYLLGCQAGKESAVTQILAVHYICDNKPNEHPHIEFKRIDAPLAKEKVSDLDKVEYIKEYQAIGDKLKNSINQNDIDYLLVK